MKLIPWSHQSPTATLSSDFESLVKDLFEGNGFQRLPEAFRRAPMPAVNLADTEKEFVATVELPGLEEKDIDLRMMGNQLTISAERKWEDEKKGKEFHRVESQFGRFERSVTLPENIKVGACDALYKKGVLTITIPKAEPTPASKIMVKAG